MLHGGAVGGSASAGPLDAFVLGQAAQPVNKATRKHAYLLRIKMEDVAVAMMKFWSQCNAKI
ncbi:hypothetical protein [Rhodoferax aquaticus]|uniref:Uncharacterized protein n=1 Tax=Rhodoferax aquaticus TaxID=2527691 RepID=A0A515ET65_9BURK|nr:hypothetical protein [Rhodoferax aquaticus]QDL55852.1 hypothetical protein EXZ61_17660 [Rhodoferax aquaticus]